jgi:hypothetical protein
MLSDIANAKARIDRAIYEHAAANVMHMRSARRALDVIPSKSKQQKPKNYEDKKKARRKIAKASKRRNMKRR